MMVNKTAQAIYTVEPGVNIYSLMPNHLTLESEFGARCIHGTTVVFSMNMANLMPSVNLTKTIADEGLKFLLEKCDACRVPMPATRWPEGAEL